MSDDSYRNRFISTAEDWICDSSSIDIRYFAYKTGDQTFLCEASITVSPLPVPKNLSFRIELSQFYAGQLQLSGQSRKKIIDILNLATQGQIHAYKHLFRLNEAQQCHFYSEMIHRDRWYSDLHLQITGALVVIPDALAIANIENGLRSNELPFDGLADIASWLGLADPQFGNSQPSIQIRVGPPVDLILSDCSLDGDKLTLALVSHPRFDISHVGLAVRAAPGNALDTRRQVSNEIKWKLPRNGKRDGTISIQLENADNAIAMLMIGDTTVRRQWFIDPSKARNNRLIAIQHFDKDLRKVRQAILEPQNSDTFEKGIASLFFLLGFYAVLQVETDSPDLVLTTPRGTMVIMECTTKIADLAMKVGKLVDRRSSLSKALQASGHPFRVEAILVCALPSDQIVQQPSVIENNKVIFFSKDDLMAVFEQLRNPIDPDAMLEDAVAKLSSRQSGLGF